MLSHLLVTLKLAPYQSNGEDISSFLSSLTLTLTTLGGIVLKMDSPDPSKKSFNAEGLGYLLIIISIMCIASQISIAIFIDCGVGERMCGRKNKNGDGTKVRPSQSSPPSTALKKQIAMEDNAKRAWNQETEN